MVLTFFFQIFGNPISILSSQYKDLLNKNKNIKTGYEHFCLKKGNIKLFPFKDFDFIGKHVVCQKCCQKFASRLSYRAHVGTDVCVRTYNGPNLVYLQYKNRNCRQTRKKNKSKPVKDSLSHDIKKNLLNPEMLNTLQTRNNCYSDIVHQRNKVKQNIVNNPIKNDDEPSVKKRRGRPRKIIEVEPKKRGRPKKLNVVIDDSSSLNSNSLDNSLESNTSYKIGRIVSVHSVVTDKSNQNNNCLGNDVKLGTHKNNDSEKQMGKIVSVRSVTDMSSQNLNHYDSKLQRFCNFNDAENKLTTIVNVHSVADTYNNNVDEIWKQNALFSKYKILTDRYFKLVITDHEEEEKSDGSGKELFYKLDVLENDLKLNCERFEEINVFKYSKEIDSMLLKIDEKRNELKNMLKKTDMNNGSTTNKGKENIQCTVIKNEDEIEINKIDFDANDKCIGVWINDGNGTPTMILENDCVSIDCLDSEDIKKKSASDDDFEETSADNSTQLCPHSTHRLNNVNLNYFCSPPLKCKICGKNFASIAEWKMHHSEHLTMVNEKFLCKICGHKFKMYKNFVKHINDHRKTEQNIIKKQPKDKDFSCKKCPKKYSLLKSYFDHIKTHDD